MNGFARQSLEDGQILLSAVDASVGVAPVLGVVGTLNRREVGHLIDIYPFGILRARCRLANQFGPAILVEVVDKKLRVVSLP